MLKNRIPTRGPPLAALFWRTKSINAVTMGVSLAAPSKPWYENQGFLTILRRFICHNLFPILLY